MEGSRSSGLLWDDDGGAVLGEPCWGTWRNAVADNYNHTRPPTPAPIRYTLRVLQLGSSGG